MSAKPTIGQLLDEHVTLTLHSLDRIYLNGYVPRLQTAGGLMEYFWGARKKAIVSPPLLGQNDAGFQPGGGDFCSQPEHPGSGLRAGRAQG
jgi:hypothetical protein